MTTALLTAWTGCRRRTKCRVARLAGQREHIFGSPGASSTAIVAGAGRAAASGTSALCSRPGRRSARNGQPIGKQGLTDVAVSPPRPRRQCSRSRERRPIQRLRNRQRYWVRRRLGPATLPPPRSQRRTRRRAQRSRREVLAAQQPLAHFDHLRHGSVSFDLNPRAEAVLGQGGQRRWPGRLQRRCPPHRCSRLRSSLGRRRLMRGCPRTPDPPAQSSSSLGSPRFTARSASCRLARRRGQREGKFG